MQIIYKSIFAGAKSILSMPQLKAPNQLFLLIIINNNYLRNILEFFSTSSFWSIHFCSLAVNILALFEATSQNVEKTMSTPDLFIEFTRVAVIEQNV